MQALDCRACEWAEFQFPSHGEVGSIAILFFRLLLKNTERCPQTAVSINFFALRGSNTNLESLDHTKRTVYSINQSIFTSMFQATTWPFG